MKLKKITKIEDLVKAFNGIPIKAEFVENNLRRLYINDQVVIEKAGTYTDDIAVMVPEYTTTYKASGELHGSKISCEFPSAEERETWMTKLKESASIDFTLTESQTLV